MAASLFRDLLQERRDGSDQHIPRNKATFASRRGTLTRIDHIAAPAGMPAGAEPVSSLGMNWNTAAVVKEHAKARSLSCDWSFPKKTRARKSERRASVVCRGHECVLDDRVEETGSDRSCRRGARRKYGEVRPLRGH